MECFESTKLKRFSIWSSLLEHRVLVELSRIPKLWMRGSFSDQIPKESIPSRLERSFSGCHHFVHRQLWVFLAVPKVERFFFFLSNPSDDSLCFFLSRMHTCPTEGSQTCNKGRSIADLKIAAYTCRPTFSSMVAVGSSDCTKCHTHNAASTKPMKEFWLCASPKNSVVRSEIWNALPWFCLSQFKRLF